MKENLKLYENKFTLPLTNFDIDFIKNHIEKNSIDEIIHEIILLIIYYESKLNVYENKI